MPSTGLWQTRNKVPQRQGGHPEVLRKMNRPVGIYEIQQGYVPNPASRDRNPPVVLEAVCVASLLTRSCFWQTVD